MTRINIVPVTTLTNSHLLAEYKEITRPFSKVLVRIMKHGVDNTINDVKIPNSYVLGTGHESFFFNKLRYLYRRYNELYKELVKRGYNIDSEKYSNICDNLLQGLSGTPYWNDYTPTPEEMYLNMARLAKRSKLSNVLEELESLK